MESLACGTKIKLLTQVLTPDPERQKEGTEKMLKKQ